MLRGLILPGVYGRPLHADRGAAGYKNISRVAAAYQKLERMGIPVSIVIPKKKIGPYARVFSFSHLVVNPGKSDLNNLSPLYDILAAHYKFPKDDLFILSSCLDIHTGWIRNQVDLYRILGPDYAYNHSFTNDQAGCLCTIYTARNIQKWSVYILSVKAVKSHPAYKDSDYPVSHFAKPIAPDSGLPCL
ncbi:MAG TPA: hypothetical protein VNE41_00330 [Chitinophagaceae bacterium]|nr:hypothetical protein [Chitinophagaceae bacterium]